jgi:multidrug efflux pump subunit AcrA (membrane-fusion protein)
MIDTKLYSTVSLVLALALGAMTVGCDPSSQASEAEANDQFVKVVNVEVTPITLTDFTAYIRLTGQVEALNDVIVSAEESGVIERLFVEKGALVRKGAAIAKIVPLIWLESATSVSDACGKTSRSAARSTTWKRSTRRSCKRLVWTSLKPGSSAP